MYGHCLFRTTINRYYQIHLEQYPKLRDFLKRQSESLHAKRSKTFTVDEKTISNDESGSRTYVDKDNGLPW